MNVAPTPAVLTGIQEIVSPVGYPAMGTSIVEAKFWEINENSLQSHQVTIEQCTRKSSCASMCDHCSMFRHMEEECRKKRVVRQERRVVNQEKDKEQSQHDTIIEVKTPRRTARRSPPNIRGNEEPTTNSFQALFEIEIMDMVTHDRGAMQGPHE
ncbi:hypothetical protein Cgig2_016507 [Carnegiea gigantea]|uniref:Uncharacterized protein n=1 Tax=Carnegiea gigantea TaxID=171969 RepID=A0A9Q1GP71_9CARY|nr:hypothetical protein Cgig2_016507 [Carnegiea gigantea]